MLIPTVPSQNFFPRLRWQWKRKYNLNFKGLFMRKNSAPVRCPLPRWEKNELTLMPEWVWLSRRRRQKNLFSDIYFHYNFVFSFLLLLLYLFYKSFSKLIFVRDFILKMDFESHTTHPLLYLESHVQQKVQWETTLNYIGVRASPSQLS